MNSLPVYHCAKISFPFLRKPSLLFLAWSTSGAETKGIMFFPSWGSQTSHLKLRTDKPHENPLMLKIQFVVTRTGCCASHFTLQTRRGQNITRSMDTLQCLTIDSWGTEWYYNIRDTPTLQTVPSNWKRHFTLAVSVMSNLNTHNLISVVELYKLI